MHEEEAFMDLSKKGHTTASRQEQSSEMKTPLSIRRTTSFYTCTIINAHANGHTEACKFSPEMRRSPWLSKLHMHAPSYINKSTQLPLKQRYLH